MCHVCAVAVECLPWGRRRILGTGSANSASPVGVPLVLDDQVLLVDGLQQSRGQRLEVGDGLRRGRQAAALLLQEHLLDYKSKRRREAERRRDVFMRPERQNVCKTST